jgi:hypothetical protein
VLPALISAAPASAQASCAGTSLKSAGLAFQVRVPPPAMAPGTPTAMRPPRWLHNLNFGG